MFRVDLFYDSRYYFAGASGVSGKAAGKSGKVKFEDLTHRVVKSSSAENPHQQGTKYQPYNKKKQKQNLPKEPLMDVKA